MSAGIVSVGAYVPARAVTNSDLEPLTGLKATWIRERTGIEERRHCAKDEDVVTMAHKAVANACARAGIAVGDIDAVVTSTNTPTFIMPGLGARLMAQSGLTPRSAPVDIVGPGCAGAVSVLQVGEQLVRSGVKLVAVVQSEASSTFMDFDDISPQSALAASIFGDGACCWLLRPCRPGSGIVYSSSRTVPEGYEGLVLQGQNLRGFSMDARAVKGFAIKQVPALIRDLEAGSGSAVRDAGLVLLHQANLRLIESVLAGLDVPMSRTCTTVQDLGNTASASVGISAARAIDAGLIQPGVTVFLAGFGSGWTTAGSVLRWCGSSDFDL
ncbi:3-oxoacyl-ACP synthase III family protein [Kitasatospora sp. NPDC096128]|uniref:3-oxoacyl-ACP synthase III family protein n=1 Tax=Kitasatospora sp. NPDC096128 TaxID=3155547 RepID=UPI003323AAE0